MKLAVLRSALALVVAWGAVGACSSKTTVLAPGDGGTTQPPCDNTKCLMNNQCIDDGTGNIQCRLQCQSQSDCPFNFHCTANPKAVTYCAADKTAYMQTKGTWGNSCKPTGGVDNNPDCDFSQAFRCYAQSPTDGNAYCTQLFCNDDTDCKGGWWCATVNYAPNAVQATRSTGQTYTVCKPREYCATCKTDVDCFSPSGIPEHCIPDKNTGFYCAPECQHDSNCNNEAQCATLDLSAPCSGNGKCVCESRARECTGDGQLCSPCRSDTDCMAGGGFCVQADYSTEHFCTVKSGVPCSVDMATGKLTAQCPMTDEANVPVGCETTDTVNVPKDQCLGIVIFGKDSTGAPVSVAGCFTPNRP
jgi:hypothetical protein